MVFALKSRDIPAGSMWVAMFFSIISPMVTKGELYLSCCYKGVCHLRLQIPFNLDLCYIFPFCFPFYYQPSQITYIVVHFHRNQNSSSDLLVWKLSACPVEETCRDVTWYKLGIISTVILKMIPQAPIPNLTSTVDSTLRACKCSSMKDNKRVLLSSPRSSCPSWAHILYTQPHPFLLQLLL